MSWCQKDVVQKALDKLVNAEDFKNETSEILSVLKELGVNEEYSLNCAKIEANDISEQLVNLKVEIDTDDQTTDVNGIFNEGEIKDKRRRPDQGNYWEGGDEPDLVDYEPPPPHKKKRGRPPKRKMVDNDDEDALAENIFETESILSEIEIDMGVLKEDDLDSQVILKTEQNLDNQVC